MSREFLYCRVSTIEQTTDNQVLEASNAGFRVLTSRVFTETVSGTTPAQERDGFSKLLDRLEQGDTLIVTKLDRLGRDTINILQTIDRLADRGIKLYCLNLGNTDLTSASGRMIFTVIGAVAQMERDQLVERTKAGLERAKAEGKILGRPKGSKSTQAIHELQKHGYSQAKVAKKLGLGLSTVKRHWNKKKQAA